MPKRSLKVYQKKIDEDLRCPLEYSLNLLGGKWKSRLICMHGNIGPMRFSELKTNLVNITDGVLASTINSLLALELVEKTGDVKENMMQQYTLTEKEESIIPLLRELCHWSEPYYQRNAGITMGHC